MYITKLPDEFKSLIFLSVGEYVNDKNSHCKWRCEMRTSALSLQAEFFLQSFFVLNLQSKTEKTYS